MNFISNYFGLTAPRSMSEAARNCRNNMRRLFHSPSIQTIVSGTMGVSMALVTTQIFQNDHSIDSHRPEPFRPSVTILAIKIGALSVMLLANAVIMSTALVSTFGDNSATTLSATTPTRNDRVYILASFNLTASSLGLISILSFISSNFLLHPLPNRLQTLSITSGGISSTIYMTETVVAFLMCLGNTAPHRTVESTAVRWSRMDSSDENNDDEESLIQSSSTTTTIFTEMD
ncbi:hypothetical protein [Candidatus Clavichlamydia salmonicola]|uniref:hypothetical protein n=1 Tax=Candidatus Clavichlamydia salmonicola TaxID=469812 RepID=UPI001890C1FC|nr:hypothetical protein [Candidatus Clavichlamydia salmonicola]